MTSDLPAIPPAAAPHRVRIPVNVHRWERISFLHWRFDPEVVERLVPPPLTVATFGDSAWVGVTPFLMHVRAPGMPAGLPDWSFPETNVRTYVVGPDGRQGLWFLRLEAASLWFVAALRSIGLPYVYRRMSVSSDGDRVQYRSEPLAGGERHVVLVEPGEPIQPDPLEQFLTARWRAYHVRGGVLLSTPVDHPPWPLRRAAASVSDAGALFGAVGLPEPTHDPLVHASPGVPVRVGLPRVVARAGGSRR